MKFSSTALSTLSAAALGFLALGIASTPAGAAATTTTFAVTANVAANCSISATGMAFGSYTGTLINTTSSTITVQCTNTTPYTVGLNAGLATGATTSNRSMTGPGSALLNYGLFSDAARGSNFVTTTSTNGNGAAQQITVYGSVPAGQFVTPGAYTDTITATVTY